MRYLVLTDIHANLEALEACLADAQTQRYDRVLLLGDLVGYGADPNAVVARARGLAPYAMVRGNHDKVACGLEGAEGFNAVARSAARWTVDALTPESRAWLAELPRGPRSVDDLIEICHGAPFDEDAYVFDELDAAKALKASSRPLCLFGHTHFTAVYQLVRDGLEAAGPFDDARQVIPIVAGSKVLLNPGSVGQPRNSDPRAAYAIVDTDARHVELFRVPYAVECAQAKIIDAGLPEILAHRLGLGR